MEKSIIKILTLIIIAGLFLQLKISRVYEPYPAILLPAGGGVVKHSDAIAIYNYKYFLNYEDGTQAEINSEDAFRTVPKGFHLYLAKNYLGWPVGEYQEKEFDQKKIYEGKEWLRNNLSKSFQLDSVDSFELASNKILLFFSENKLDSTSLIGKRSIVLIKL